MKKGCNHQFQCMQETWRQDAKNRGQTTSLSEHEEIENLRFLRLVHRCNRQKKVSSVRKDKRRYVTVTFFRDRFIHIKNESNHSSMLPQHHGIQNTAQTLIFNSLSSHRAPREYNTFWCTRVKTDVACKIKLGRMSWSC